MVYPHTAIATDGLWYPDAIGALQRYAKRLGYYNYNVDGVFGIQSRKAMQRIIRREGYYSTAYRIDGDIGNATRNAMFDMLQYKYGFLHLNYLPNKFPQRDLVIGWQRYLNAKRW